MDAGYVIKGLEESIAFFRDRVTGNMYDKWLHASADAIALLKALDVTPEELERLKKCRHECKIDCLLEHYEKIKAERDALQKAQEAKPPVVKENSYGWKFYYCPSCGKEFYQNNKFSFCEKCGQEVLWE